MFVVVVVKEGRGGEEEGEGEGRGRGCDEIFGGVEGILFSEIWGGEEGRGEREREVVGGLCVCCGLQIVLDGWEGEEGGKGKEEVVRSFVGYGMREIMEWCKGEERERKKKGGKKGEGEEEEEGGEEWVEILLDQFLVLLQTNKTNNKNKNNNKNNKKNNIIQGILNSGWVETSQHLLKLCEGRGGGGGEGWRGELENWKWLLGRMIWCIFECCCEKYKKIEM